MKLGIIGFGGRAQGVLKLIREIDDSVELMAVCDIKDDDSLKEAFSKSGLRSDIPIYKDASLMLEQYEFDGILVGTRCSLHTEMALKVMGKGIPMYLEKPVATNLFDLKRLEKAYEDYKGSIIVSFPLKTSPMVGLAAKLIKEGKIGKITQIQAWNNVPYGGVYYHSWYRDENETGGLFLQKATHDFDYINFLAGAGPVRICAMTSKVIYKGNKKAGLLCKECNENRSCPESPYVLEKKSGQPVMGEYCCFAADTGNEDSGSAIIEYDSGIHACYTQNFIARKKAGSRGARLIGYEGTMEFDWYTNKLKIYSHTSDIDATYDFDVSKNSHFGGDMILAENFIEVMKKSAASVSGLGDGLLSSRMCIAAGVSAREGKFVDISSLTL
ncbi:MAG TPA: Gfo/Idh/MocA family oxidoreductase [Clostridia bacterium]|nr:Gfo/Idh/MocA family oxidoreductase [Clostridia bacterium]